LKRGETVRELKPNLAQMTRLYEAAIAVKALAPWAWMTEEAVFGVQHPETGDIGFVSVMGALGEHYAIAVYLGREGLDGFWKVHSGKMDYPEELLHVPHLQASFENRSELTQKDRDEIKALGLGFRGRYAWPMFRSYRPGCFPWYLEAEETQFLALVLEQLVDVAPRVRGNRGLLYGDGHDAYLVRVAGEADGGRVWKDVSKDMPPVALEPIPLLMNFQVLEHLKGLPPSDTRIEVDLFMFPARIGKRGERPRCAFMLLVVEGEQGLVLGHKMLEPDPTIEAMYGRVPLTLAALLANRGLVPKAVKVRTHILAQLLQPLVEGLGFEAKRSIRLPALDQAKEFMMGRFS
jgi:hypothetical protein